jgi:hypothetical protein
MKKKYDVYVPYTLWVVKEVEAENEDEAIDNVDVDNYLSFCYNCMEDNNIVNYPDVNLNLVYAEERK